MSTLDLDVCWQAVVARDRGRDGSFVFAVKTTGVFCRPSCSARQPRRENVSFFLDPAAAKAAGFRACKRCRPEEPAIDRQRERIVALCADLRERVALGEEIVLGDLGAELNMSAGHFRRLFQAAVGTTPRAFVESCRLAAVKDQLKSGSSVTDAIYGAGFGSGSRLYERVDDRFGMTPRQFQQGGRALEISYAVLETRFGPLILAATDRGLCLVEFGSSIEELEGRLRQAFPAARIASRATGPSPELTTWRDSLLEHLEGKAEMPELPTDVRGTVFQSTVWRYLQSIPRGEVRSYGEVARGIGRPRAVRAVASACAKNPIAIVVPCHRVIRGDGDPGGYRWGLERKRDLLRAEAQGSQA
jgi:AraC family transcriptional regulator, regulatory protein of adaptative response / methylated-DNA-[protein]-cysteine methyltransferase